MPICPKCNTEAPEGIEICSNCGNSFIQANPPKPKIHWLKWVALTAIIGYVVWNQNDSNGSGNDSECLF